ncbi:MAG: hypothetical protein ACKOMX_09765 [Actinomycetota bacterium]
MGSLAQRLSGPALVAWPVFALVIVWSVILVVFGSGGTAQGPLVIRAGCAAVGGVLACLVMAGAWWLVIRRLRGTGRLVVVFVAMIVSGVVRGATLQALLVGLGYAESTLDAAVTRMATSAVTITFAFAFGAAAWGSVAAYRETAARLLAEQRRLAALVDASASGIEQQQAEAVDRVREQLDAEIRDLPLTSGSEAISALGSLATDVVRPLSHSLALELPPVEPTIPESPPRVTLADVLRNPAPAVAIRPFLLTSLLMVLGLPTALLIYSPIVGVLLVLTAAVVITPLLFAGRVWLRRSPPSTVVQAWARIVGLLLAIGLTTSFTISVLERVTDGVGALPLTSLFAVVVVGLLLAVASMLDERMREITDALAAVAVSMRWQLARVRAQQWEQRGRISRALHGPVQSLLHAQLMRLRRGLDDGSMTDSGLEDLRDQLKTALVGALAPSPDAVSVPALLDDVAATWDGVATITHGIGADSVAALQADPLCARVIADLASEAVSNSVRHGGASTVMIEIEPSGADELELRVVDDGHFPSDALPGFGTTVLTECTVEWHLSSGTPTTLTARVPTHAG